MLSRPWWDTWAAAEVAHQMALLPLVWLACLAHAGKARDAAWWWLASAFAVSWLADTATDLLPKTVDWVPVLAYPVAQSALVGAVFLTRRLATVLLVALAGVALLVAVSGGSRGPDIILTSAACLAVVGIVLERPSIPPRLRLSLLVYFGVGLIAWVGHAFRLDLGTYYAYQAVRLLGLILFCWAAIGPERSLKAV